MSYLRRVFWEYPLTAWAVIVIFFFYFLVNLFVPTEIINKYFLTYPGKIQPLNWVLSTLYHGSIAHLMGNLFFLFFLGRVVEYKSGRKNWLIFFWMAGFLSAFAEVVIRGFILDDFTPVVGASGAISGLAAVAAMLSPFSLRLAGVNFPFPMFLIAWSMVYTDVSNLFTPDRIAHWAHLAGFASVAIASYLISPQERRDLRTGLFLNAGFFTLTVLLLFFINHR